MEYDHHCSHVAFPSNQTANAVPTIMVTWGLVTTFMCLVNTYQGLLV
jgi:hypothetical protein